MNTNIHAKRILLYGDSLVYGKVSGENARLDSKTRFSCVLQDLLGGEYEVIEEGLRARTMSGENKSFPERNGLEQFGPILGSHLPLDLLVILLGTNDCNATADKTPEKIAEELKEYSPIVKNWCKVLAAPIPQLLIVAPPYINEAYYDEVMARIFGKGAGSKTQELGFLYEKVARELGVEFLNSATVCQPAPGDGIHLDAQGNRQLAAAMHEKIKEIL